MKIHIIGAGIAGLSASRALVNSGHTVTLIEKGPGVASGASGNPAGIFKPILGSVPTLQSELSFLAVPALTAELQRLTSLGYEVPHSTGGLIQFAKNAEEEARFKKALSTRSHPTSTWLEPEEVRARTGIRSALSGILWHSAGWVSPAKLCEAWRAELENTDRFTLEHRDQSLDPEALARSEADAIILCTGPTTRTLPEFTRHQTQLIRGQLSILDFNIEVPPALPTSFHEYIIPLTSSRFLIGATHDREDPETQTRPEDHERLLARFGDLLPEDWKSRPQLHAPVAMRAGIRFNTQSRVPILGLLDETSAKAGRPVHAFTALGSRGIHWCTLLGDVLADLINRQPLRVPLEIMRAMKP